MGAVVVFMGLVFAALLLVLLVLVLTLFIMIGLLKALMSWVVKWGRIQISL